jgi:pimeloyl-ACP methyl ester carboxylesterase
LLSNIIRSEALDLIEHGVFQINVPTLLIVGSKDSVIPPIATSKYLSHYIKDIDVKVAINAGHNPYRDTPEQYQEFIDEFLKRINK